MKMESIELFGKQYLKIPSSPYDNCEGVCDLYGTEKCSYVNCVEYDGGKIKQSFHLVEISNE